MIPNLVCFDNIVFLFTIPVKTPLGPCQNGKRVYRSGGRWRFDGRCIDTVFWVFNGLLTFPVAESRALNLNTAALCPASAGTPNSAASMLAAASPKSTANRSRKRSFIFRGARSGRGIREPECRNRLCPSVSGRHLGFPPTVSFSSFYGVNRAEHTGNKPR